MGMLKEAAQSSDSKHGHAGADDAGAAADPHGLGLRGQQLLESLMQWRGQVSVTALGVDHHHCKTHMHIKSTHIDCTSNVDVW